MLILTPREGLGINLDPHFSLDEMDNEDRENLVTLLKEEMRHTLVDYVLFYRYPLDIVHVSAVDNEDGENSKCSEGPVTKTSLGV